MVNIFYWCNVILTTLHVTKHSIKILFTRLKATITLWFHWVENNPTNIRIFITYICKKFTCCISWYYADGFCRCWCRCWWMLVGLVSPHPGSLYLPNYPLCLTNIAQIVSPNVAFLPSKYTFFHFDETTSLIFWLFWNSIRIMKSYISYLAYIIYMILLLFNWPSLSIYQTIFKSSACHPVRMFTRAAIWCQHQKFSVSLMPM